MPPTATPNSEPWSPPTAEAVEQHLEAHRPAAASPWTRRMPLMILGGVVVLALLLQGPAAWVLPWAAFVGLIIYGGRRVRSQRRLERRVGRAHELAMLRYDRPALRSAWRLVPELIQKPALQHRAVLVIAQTLDRVGAYDAAIVAYDRLLEDLPEQHPGALGLKVNRAIAALHSERLSDADEALRRLRGPMESMAGTATDAAYRFALLFQSVRTAHYAEAIEESADLLETLRPLGIDAGYGHALLAWCHRQRNDPAADDITHAQRWWRRAVTLLPAAALRTRFPEIKGMDVE